MRLCRVILGVVGVLGLYRGIGLYRIKKVRSHALSPHLGIMSFCKSTKPQVLQP